MVSKILRHKYDQGWKFLTAWEGYPISSSTWEPMKSFKLADGKWNSVFEDYCRKVGISIPPGRIMHVRDARMCMSSEHGTHNFQNENWHRGKNENFFFSRMPSTAHRIDNGKNLGEEVFACSEPEPEEYKREVLSSAPLDKAYSWDGRPQQPNHPTFSLFYRTPF